MSDDTHGGLGTGMGGGSGGSQMIMFMMFFLTMFIMFQPDMRDAVGNAAWGALYPIIGFGSHYPVLTIFMAGLMMICLTTIIRHFFIDWIDAAKNQRMMKDFNKELRDARMAKNDAKVSKLMKKQPEIMKASMTSSMNQMKPMMFTMIFIIATFTFLGVFARSLPSTILSVPWAHNVNMTGSIVCGFENWILVYFLVSMSFSQVLQRVLKWYSFNKRLEELDAVGQ